MTMSSGIVPTIARDGSTMNSITPNNNSNNGNTISPTTPSSISTLNDEVAIRLGLTTSTSNNSKTPSSTSPRHRRRSYYWFKQYLILSQILDPIQIPNSFVNYQCVWWKSISGNDMSSILYDDGVTYDLLPPITRLIVSSKFVHLYPRYHHTNVELRTRYLDIAMIEHIIPQQTPSLLSSSKVMDKQYQREQQHQHQQHQQQTLPITLKTSAKKKKKLRIVLMGGGYDLRSIRIASKLQQQQLYNNKQAQQQQQQQQEHHQQQEHQQQQNERKEGFVFNMNNIDLVELDLPNVIAAKKVLLQERLLKRRPQLQDLIHRIKFYETDLNDISQVQDVINQILLSSSTSNNNNNTLKNNDKNNQQRHNDDESNDDNDWFTIFVFEAVMIYLDEHIPSKILSILSQSLHRHDQLGAVCFADTLRNVNETENNDTTTTTTENNNNNNNLDDDCERMVSMELENNGWKLQDFIRKPGKTRHLGYALLK